MQAEKYDVDTVRETRLLIEAKARKCGMKNFDLKVDLALRGWNCHQVEWVKYGGNRCACSHPIAWQFFGRTQDGEDVVLGSECIWDVYQLQNKPKHHVEIMLKKEKRRVQKLREEAKLAKRRRLIEDEKLLMRAKTDVLRDTWFVKSGFLDSIRSQYKNGKFISDKQLNQLRKAAAEADSRLATGYQAAAVCTITVEIEGDKKKSGFWQAIKPILTEGLPFHSKSEYQPPPPWVKVHPTAALKYGDWVCRWEDRYEQVSVKLNFGKVISFFYRGEVPEKQFREMIDALKTAAKDFGVTMKIIEEKVN